MKNFIKYILQSIFGFQNYLLIFSLFKIYTLRWDNNENDFFFFMKLLPKNGIVLDIGANIGIMTVHFAKKLRNARVYSYEPIPRNVKVLKKIISLFKLGNVRIFETALGNENGKVEMIMPVINSVKMQGLSHVVHESIPACKQGKKYNVEIKKDRKSVV